MTISLAIANFVLAFIANATGHSIICDFAIGILFVLVAVFCEAKILSRIEKLEKTIRLKEC